MRRVVLHHKRLGIRKLRAQGEMNLLCEGAHQGDAVYIHGRETSNFEGIRNGSLRQSAGVSLPRHLAFFNCCRQFAVP